MTDTYGDKGNRWWVGMNVGETGGQSTIFGKPSIGLLRPSNYESLPSGNLADDKQFASAAKKNKGTRKPNTISVEHIQWFNIQGPFTTQDAANKAIPAIEKANPAPGVLGQVAQDNKGNPVGDAASAASAAVSDASAVTNFLGNLGNPNLWIRAVKIVAGSVILIVGLVKITGADKSVGGIAAKAVKAAPLL